MASPLPSRRVNPLAQASPIEEEEEREIIERRPVKTRQEPSKPKAQKVEEVKVVRDKYTATMDRQLRRRVKISAINKGIDFSKYVEIAVKEKMEREGE